MFDLCKRRKQHTSKSMIATPVFLAVAYGSLQRVHGQGTFAYETGLNGFHCYLSASDCNSAASTNCGSSYSSVCYFSAGPGGVCSTTDSGFMYSCPAGNTGSTATPSPTASYPGPLCFPPSCSCNSCSAAQTCVSVSGPGRVCPSGQAAQNFQCSIMNGVGSWTASCASPVFSYSSPPPASASTNTKAWKIAIGVCLPAAAVFVASYLIHRFCCAAGRVMHVSAANAAPVTMMAVAVPPQPTPK